jgi:hypothetical protein
LFAYRAENTGKPHRWGLERSLLVDSSNPGKTRSQINDSTSFDSHFRSVLICELRAGP